MAEIKWGLPGARRFETGVDHGVLYVRDNQGAYPLGVPWNGVVSIAQNPTGAEASAQYADNIKYLNIVSAEEFAATIEAFTYPDEWAACDGSAEPIPGVHVGQQSRKTFGLSWRSKIGNDIDGLDHGFKIHVMYEGLAAPTEKSSTTINESPEAQTFSWDISTTAVEVPGLKPAAHLEFDSTKVNSAGLAALMTILYGTEGVDPRLPLPAEIFALFAGSITEATPAEPTYDAATKTIAIPVTTGVVYQIDGKTVTGNVVITKDTVVTARPAAGFKFPAVTDDDWFYDFS